MPKTNLHTFIIPAYKESQYIEDCILSLQKQTMQSDIAVSTSTPSVFLKNVCEKFNIPLIINTKKTDNQIASDWSFAYNSCKTQYVTLAHQDDKYLPDYTQTLLTIAEKNNHKHSIIFTDYAELLKNNKIRSYTASLFIKRLILLPLALKRQIRSSFCKKLLLYFGNPISCPTVMYNKELLGSFQFPGEFLCSLDWDTWVGLINRLGDFGYAGKQLMLHRIHKDAESFRLTKDKTRKKEEEMLLSRLWSKPIAKILTFINSLFHG